jgi:two-component system, sensor histidine kinase LadS
MPQLFRTYLFVVPLILFFCQLSHGQYNGSSSDIVALHKGELVQLLEHSQLLEDTGSDLSWQQALASNHWLDIEGNGLNLGITNSRYWFRVDFSYFEAQTRVFQIGYPFLDYVDFYLLSNDQLIKHEATGDLLPLESRTIKDKDFVLSHFHNNKDVLTLLIRVNTQGTMVLPLTSISIEQYAESESIENIAYGIYFGITAAMFLYNFMLFIYLKDSTYLYYCVFVFIIFISALSYTGHGFYWLWPSHSQLNTFMVPFTAALGFLAATLFISSFLQMKKRGALSKYILNLSIGLSLVIILVSILMSYSASIKIISFVQLVFTVIFLSYSISLWYKEVSEAKYFTLAWLSFIIGSMISATRVLGLLPSNNFTLYANLYGNVIEMLMLSMGLAYRFEMMRKVQAGLSRELRLAQQDAIKHLEKYRDLFQYSPVGLFSYDRDSNKFQMNKKISVLIGSGVEIGEFLNNSLSFSDYKHLIRTGEIKDKLIKINSDCYFNLSLFTSRNNDKRIVEVEGTLLDISEQKKSEVIRIDSEKEKLSSLSQLVFGISHQFNTPLGVLVATDDLIKNGLASLIEDVEGGHLKREELMRALTNMQDAISLSSTNTLAMASILKDLRYSINTRAELNLSEISTVRLFEDLFGYFKSQLRENKIDCKLGIDIDTNGIDLLNSDYEVLSDAILRLFSNTYYHAYSNVTVAGMISIRLKEDESFYYIEYFDDGRGLDKTEKNSIFIPFYTGSSRKKDNSGLGMYILHNQIVKVLHGKVELLSPVSGFGIKILLPKHYSET